MIISWEGTHTFAVGACAATQRFFTADCSIISTATVPGYKAAMCRYIVSFVLSPACGLKLPADWPGPLLVWPTPSTSRSCVCYMSAASRRKSRAMRRSWEATTTSCPRKLCLYTVERFALFSIFRAA